jgi:glutamate racemase
MTGPIGVFDSGYGGLTILRDLRSRLGDMDFLYLGDNARAPYGTRSFDVIYHYTLQAVEALFERGCPLVILACNTASARALRTIQQKDLPRIAPDRRVLGIIRPVAEFLAHQTQGDIGILATPGTVRSESYPIEIAKLAPGRVVAQQACPLWVPLVESGELDNSGADFFVQRDLEQLSTKTPNLRQVVLGCTHYPLLRNTLHKVANPELQIIEQGPIVAASLADYLHRHPEMEIRIRKNRDLRLLTTEDPEFFASRSVAFLGHEAPVERIQLF